MNSIRPFQVIFSTQKTVPGNLSLSNDNVSYCNCYIGFNAKFDSQIASASQDMYHVLYDVITMLKSFRYVILLVFGVSTCLSYLVVITIYVYLQ